MQILIIDDRVPDPHFGAGFPRAYRLLLSVLKLGHRVFFFPTVKDSIKDLNIQLLKGFGIEVCDDLEKIKNEKIDVAILSRPHNVHYFLPPVRRLFPDAKVIYDTEALWFRRYDLQLEITGRLPGWAYRYDEIGLAQQVDLCFVVNDVEKTILESNGVKRVMILGHALDVHDAGQPYEQRSNLLFVGGKLEDDSSNEDALWTFLEGSWTEVWNTLQCEMDVTGQVLTSRLQNNVFGNVNLKGHIDDLVPLYESRRVFVAATRFATGIPWKVHEAMAHGIPCVVSRLLGDQLGMTDDSAGMVCNNAQEFVEKTVKLYSDQSVWHNVRQNAFDLIRRDCDPEKFKQVIEEAIAVLTS